MYFEKQIVRGYNAYLTRGVDDQNSNMDVGLLVLEAGDMYAFEAANDELALDLLVGDVEFAYEDKCEAASRPDTFHHAA